MNELVMGSLFGELNIVEAKSESVIALLPTMTDEQVKMTHSYAQEVGKAAWRVECAANAEILKRVQERAWQRNGDGVVATLASVAYDLGVSPRTMYQDAQIHKSFFEKDSSENIARACNVLHDKQFYKIAISSTVPQETLEKMAAKKSENPFYSASDAFREVRLESQQVLRQELKDNPIPLPTGTYRCIVIDPPWPIEKIEREARPNQSSALDYPTMTLEEIEALPIADMASLEGCHVYLWVTQKFLREGFRLFEAWGVRYQCLMTWVKPTGMTPYSWMYNTEHILFGRVGSLPLERMGLKLSLDAPATGHSVKPAAFYERVSEASPPPRIELFARSPRPGFDGWGNESLTLGNE